MLAEAAEHVAMKSASATHRDVSLLVMSLRDDKLVDHPPVVYNGTNHTEVTRTVVRYAQALDVVDMLTKQSTPCPQSWSQTGQYDPLTEISDVIFQGFKGKTKKETTGIKLEQMNSSDEENDSGGSSSKQEDGEESEPGEGDEDKYDSDKLENGIRASPIKLSSSSKSSSSVDPVIRQMQLEMQQLRDALLQMSTKKKLEPHVTVPVGVNGMLYGTEFGGIASATRVDGYLKK
jgi:hypothetical protein